MGDWEVPNPLGGYFGHIGRGRLLTHEEEMPWRIAQHDEARESIARRIRNSTRGGKQNE